MKKQNDFFEYEITDGSAEILRCFPFGKRECAGDEQAVVQVPETLEGARVTAVGDYAFSPERTDGGQQIAEILLPRGVRRIGRYAFYNCRRLGHLEIPERLTDLGAGAFTGCHRVRELTAHIEEAHPSCLKEILMELPEALTVRYLSEEGEARLVFPEYFEEGVENTPARIIETHLHGSGMQYRNCFVQRRLQFEEYDGCFALARAQEETELLVKLAFLRLLYPLGLSGRAKERYMAFLSEHLRAAARYALGSGGGEALALLLKEVKPKKEELPELLAEALKTGDARAVSRIQAYRKERFGEEKPKARPKDRFAL